jgi:hypothetical protein
MHSAHQESSTPEVYRQRHRNVLPGEDVALYDGLRAELEARYAPQTILEEMEVDHLLNTLWEIRRLVRIKPQVLNIDRKRALVELIQQTLFNHQVVSVDDIEKGNVLAGSYFGSEDEREKIEKVLARFGLDDDAITAKAFVMNAATLEGIENQIQLATARAFVLQGQLETIATRRNQSEQKKPLRLTNKGLRVPK